MRRERAELFDKIDSNGVENNSLPEYRSGDPDGLIVDSQTGLRVIPREPVIDGRLIDGALVMSSAQVNSVFTSNSHFFVIGQ